MRHLGVAAVSALARLGDAANALDGVAAVVVVFEIDGDRALLAVVLEGDGADEALVPEHLGQAQLELGRRDDHLGLARGDGVAYAAQHIGNRIVHCMSPLAISYQLSARIHSALS